MQRMVAERPVEQSSNMEPELSPLDIYADLPLITFVRTGIHDVISSKRQRRRVERASAAYE